MKITTGFVPDNCIESAASICAMSVTYEANADTNSDRDMTQTLTITAENSGVGEGGWYFNIKTDKWSVDNPSDLAYMIEDFKNRLMTNTTPESELKVYKERKEDVIS